MPLTLTLYCHRKCCGIKSWTENAKQGVLAEPENIGDKKLSRREDVESAASSVEREAVSENIGHESSATGALDQRYVNSMHAGAIYHCGQGSM